MEKIETPDGVIEIPDNIDPIKRSELAGAVKRLYNIDINKVSLLDRVVDAPKSIARGALSTTASVPQGLVGLFDIGNDSELYKGLTGYRDFLREDSIFASDPKLRDKYSTKLAEGFGSFGPFLGAGLAGRALAAKGVVGPVTGTFGLPAALAVPTGISEQADRQAIAREMGEEVGVGAEIASELIGGVIGLTEIFPVTAFLKKVPKSALRNPELKSKLETLAKDFGTGFLQEGSQELFASLAQDLTARGLYSDSLPIGESAFDEFTIGGIVGGTAKALINSLGRKPGITKEYAEEKARREQKNKKELLQTKKFEMGIAQGEVEEVQNIPPVVKPELVTPEVTIPEPDLEVVSLPNNTFSVVDNNNTTQPIVANFNSEAEALTNKDKLMTDFNNTKLKTELENQLYIQGNINSGTAFEIGQSLLDPIATTVTPNDVMAAKNKISDKAKTKFLNENKNPLTLTEAKKNLNKTEFNNLTQALAAAQFKANEDNGQPPITAGKNKIDVSPKYIKELAASKNIDKFSFNTPAVAHALEIYTGNNNFDSMSRGQKELLVSRLHAIPKFNQKREFPDFRPRDYSAKDTADFISNIGKTPFTLKDTQTYFDGDKQKASSFISDLKSSGRVDYLKDEGAYQVKDNFEFEIARRAESFGQTPQEFGETLKQEGKLSEEAINQLIAEETVRQEKVLPPAEIEPKIFNLAEAVEEGRTNKFAKEIRKQLDKFGLKETGIVVSDDILSSTALTEPDATGRIRFNPSETRGAEGEYDKQTDIIFLSLNAVNPDGNATDLEIQQRLNSIINHEIIHALRYKDLITEPEYNYLRKLVKSRKVSKTYDENYTGKTFYERSIAINKETIESRRRQGLNISKEFEEEFYVEEAIAEMYRAKDIAADIPPKAQGIYNKIVNFFKGVGQAMRLSGYKNLANVFQDIEQGIVGARTRGEIRTTRELDRGAPITSLPPDLQAEKDSRDRAAAQAKQPVEETEQGAVIETTQTPKELSRLEPSIPTRPTPPPPTTPTTPPVISQEPVTGEPIARPNPEPNTIYDSLNRSAEEAEAEREIIINGLVQAKVITKSDGENIKSNKNVRVQTDTIPMVKWLVKNSPSKDYRILASKSLETLNKLEKEGASFPLTFVSSKKRFGGQVEFSPFGMNFAMTLRTDRNLNFETMLHEILHSSTLFQMSRAQRIIQNDNAPDFLKEGNKDLGKVFNISEKTKQGFKNLEEQKIRIKEYIAEEKRKFTKLTKELDFNAFRKAVEYTKGNPILENLAVAIASKAYIDNSTYLKNWNARYINYVVEGGKPRIDPDVSELITFGLTDRQFQTFLENIPYDDKGKKTVWNKFVESIRDILNLPAKLDTEFAAFLNNAADIFYDPEVTQTKLRAPPGDVPSFSRAQTTPSNNEVPVTEEYDVSDIESQLRDSRSGKAATLDEAPPIKTFITDIFANPKNKKLADASKQFLKKFINKNENLILFRAINLPEGENIRNYGQLETDEFVSTTLNHKQANKIARSVASSMYGKKRLPKILRYEVPMDRVKGYVPMLLKSVEENYRKNKEEGYYSGSDMTEADIQRAEEKAMENDEYFERPYQSIEEMMAEEMEDFDTLMDEAEVLVDLRGIKPNYQYNPGNYFRESEFIADVPLFFKGTRYASDNNTSENIKLVEAVKTAEEEAKSQPRGGIPRYNTNASDIALQAAIEFDNDPSMKAPNDIPLWSKPSLDSVDQDIKEGVDRTGGAVDPQKSFGARLIDVAKDPITNIRYAFRNFRQSYVDKLDKIDKKLTQATLDSEEVRQANNTADTATMAALRLTDRARGLFQSMLTTGTITDKIEGISALSNVIKGKDGGLIEILAPLYSNPDVDQESIFKFYASLKRTEQFLKDGRKVKSPITDADLALINKIETQYPDVKNTFEAYQRWNNELITFAENKGLLSKFKSNNQIIEELEKKELIDKTIAVDLKKLSQANEGRSLPEIVELGKQNGIDTRGQGQIWREHSSYYPFYREMVDDSEIAAPTIGGGALPNNPLSIALEGSEDVLNVNPLEAISRNSLSILTASLKNDGLAKLVRDLVEIKEAEAITPEQAGQKDSIFVFEDGIKKHYRVDKEIINALQSVGGTYSGSIEKVLAMPAGFLRDTVTRDPGFVIVNVLRDTLSSMVTSGANFIPIIDSFKNLGRSMEDLEKFGVLGGYDFANDEGSIKQYITRTMRREGLAPDNGMSAEKAFFKLWDGLGGLTTKSDGATRLAVYESVYKKLKAEGYNEAQAQSEAAYQSLEIINFGRRGLDPMFKVITAAIPFFNARIQGLDVLYRSVTGKYSAVEKLQSGETQADVKSRIQKKVALNASILAGITLVYYLLTHDSEEYKNLKREVRDDNWIIPLAHNHALKIPVPFEVGFLFKTIPERLFDMTLGDNAFTQASADEALTSFTRGLGTSLNLPIIGGDIGIQAIKPLQEAIINRNSFTGQDIIPYFQLQREPGYQARETTNVLAKGIGEALNISPAKIEHVMRGYTGTLGGYVIALSDTIARGVTGEPLLPNNANLFKQLPVVNRLILERDKSGGLQQQFYELRSEVDRFVSTINALKKQKRFDELSAYRSNNQGVTNIKGQVRAMEKYLDNWRKRRTALFQNKNLSVLEKSERLREMELERDKRLAFVPELRKRAEIPVFNLGL